MLFISIREFVLGSLRYVHARLRTVHAGHETEE
jgi:hypothetical protein